jgi:hypothetical protein
VIFGQYLKCCVRVYSDKEGEVSEEVGGRSGSYLAEEVGLIWRRKEVAVKK